MKKVNKVGKLALATVVCSVAMLFAVSSVKADTGTGTGTGTGTPTGDRARIWLDKTTYDSFGNKTTISVACCGNGSTTCTPAANCS